MLARLLLFALLIWVIRGVLRSLFGGSRSAHPKMEKRDPAGRVVSNREHMEIPKEDVIDVDYTEVKPRT